MTRALRGKVAGMTNWRELRVYVNDHLAGAVGGTELARRIRGRNEGTPLGDYLGEFLDEVGEERRVLERLLHDMGLAQDRVKQAAAFALEKASRFYRHDRLGGSADLRRLLEVETLCSGVETKRDLWRSLKQIERLDARIAAIDPTGLEEQAAGQRAKLEGFRLEAAARALHP